MLPLTLTTVPFIVLMMVYHEGVQAINIANTATLDVSSTLSYNKNDYKQENAVDGVFQGDTDTCGCCYASSNEALPFFQATFDEPKPVMVIVIEGRKDSPTYGDNLTVINVQLDDTNASVFYDPTTNTATVYPRMPIQTIRVQRPRPSNMDDWYLIICELKMYSGSNLIPTIKENVITSMLPPYWQGHNASFAINGNVETELEPLETCKCCSVANPQPDPYWQIDLGRQYLIKAVYIIGRQGEQYKFQSIGLQPYIKNQTDNTNGLPLTDNLESGVLYVFVFQQPRVFQLLKVKQTPNVILTLCEVKMTEGECNIGSFGDMCRRYCNCRDQHSCNAFTGLCKTPGCLPGWKGESCETACQHGEYGADCAHHCHCLNDEDCDDVTGVCNNNACAPGWRMESCNEACGHRTFGLNCSSRCHCRDNSTCNNVNGTCANGLCNDGWQTTSCNEDPDETAPVGAGSSGSSLFTACDRQTFGTNCSLTCHCFNNTECNNVNGACHNGRCEPGWKTESCSSKCGLGSFGLNCDASCHCRNNSPCNNVNGTCSNELCEDGWRGSSCSDECNNRTFGTNCSSACHCLHTTECDNVNGVCHIGQCEPGWYTNSCSLECVHGSFGITCSSQCHCFNHSKCDKIDGICHVGRCIDGWQGGSCNITLTESQTTGSSSGAAIGGGIAAAVVVIVVIALVVVYLKRRKPKRDGERRLSEPFNTVPKPVQNEKTLDDGDKQVTPEKVAGNDNPGFKDDANEYYNISSARNGIGLRHMWHYIRRYQANDNKLFNDEFQTLPHGLVYPYEDSQTIHNRKRNRYRGMYAYDHSRVILQITEPGDTDYINACHINGYETQEKFIASQGPTETMVNDFWRMVWQQKVSKIVMLTNPVEAGSVKCVKYWPEEGEELFGSVYVKVVETDQNVDYIRREIVIRMNEGPERRITQFHFQAWPDKDVPDSTWSLVNFWRAASRHDCEFPIVVHCSAGIGRTGTYIALDILSNQMKAEGVITPLKVVQTLRQQRVNMVQTKDQYAFLHEAVADAFGIGTHFVWSSQFQAIYDYMAEPAHGSSQTKFADQFDMAVTSVKNGPGIESGFATVHTESTLASESNVYEEVDQRIEPNHMKDLGVSFLPTYNGTNAFLVAKSPTNKMISGFWSLVQEEKVKTIISLCDTKAENYKDCCSLGTDKNTLIGRQTVNITDEKSHSAFIVRTFTLTEQGKGQEPDTTVKVFDYTAWKHGHNVPEETASLLDLVEAVNEWQSHLSLSNPILIHCPNGTGKSGILCLFLSELQRMAREGGQTNVLDSLMQIKDRHRGIIQNVVQYRFCYDVIRAYIHRQQNHNIYANM